MYFILRSAIPHWFSGFPDVSVKTGYIFWFFVLRVCLNFGARSHNKLGSLHHPWDVTRSSARISPRRTGLYRRAVYVGSMVDPVRPGMIFLRVRRFSSVSIIPPMLHTGIYWSVVDGVLYRH